MINNFEEPKPTKQKIMNQIVSPIPKKVLSCSNNDNLQMKATNHPNLISNFENSSNLQKFIFHKNSAFRYFYKAKGSSILSRKLIICYLIEALISRLRKPTRINPIS